MAAGELSERDRRSLDLAIRRAEQASRFEFSVYAGPVDGPDARSFATRLHQRLVAPARSVLVMVDPRRRVVEVVTGADVRRTLTDEEVEAAVAAMTSTFADGTLLEGLERGLAVLAEHA